MPRRSHTYAVRLAVEGGGQVIAGLVLGGLALVIAWSFGPAEIGRVVNLFTDATNMGEYARGCPSPNFHDWKHYVGKLIVTIQIAIWGTFLAVVFGTPLRAPLLEQHCFGMDRPAGAPPDGCSPSDQRARIRQFVVAVGLFAGVVALFVHNMGIISKLFSDAVEAIDPRPVEDIRATGTTRLQETIYNVVPQVMPLWISFALYRPETNVRSAPVLGIVGAGGIGQILFEPIRGFYYAETAGSAPDSACQRYQVGRHIRPGRDLRTPAAHARRDERNPGGRRLSTRTINLERRPIVSAGANLPRFRGRYDRRRHQCYSRTAMPACSIGSTAMASSS